MTLDADATLYVSDPGNYRVQKVSLAGSGTTTTTAPGTTTTTAPATTTTTAADSVDPSIQFTSPTAIRVGQSTTLDYNCTDLGGSGLFSCNATLGDQTIASGRSLSSASRGTYIITIRAIDGAGNTATETTSLTVNGNRELTGSYSDLEGAPGAIARLYMATFNREPEGDGFEYWTRSYTKGMTLQEMADYFAIGHELKSLYNTTTDSEFVDSMYLNVMDRPAETAGHTFWLGRLGNDMSRARMLLMFSDSTEFRAASQPE